MWTYLSRRLLCMVSSLDLAALAALAALADCCAAAAVLPGLSLSAHRRTVLSEYDIYTIYIYKYDVSCW